MINKNRFSIKRILSGFLLIVFVLGIFISGIFLGYSHKNNIQPIEETAVKSGQVTNANREEVPEYLTKDVDFKIFWQVWDYIMNNYVEKDVMPTELFYGALRGMVASLKDPYSVFLEPETSKKFQQELAGSFEGIGAEIGIRKEKLTIIAPLPDNPAEKAGLKAGDQVLAIDDIDTSGIALDYAVNLIRGPKGSKVKLMILHNGDTESKAVEIVRDTIRIVSVSWSMEPGEIADIKLKYFNEDTLLNFNKIADEIVAKNPKGIILDLRNNPGGLLSTAIDIASNWIGSDEIIVIEKMRDKEYLGHKSTNKNIRFKGIPTVVLINKGSASGSEIVAGALQDYKSATVVGEMSFGKGSVQDLRQLSDGSSLKLTIAKWLTPAGREIDNVGIKQDIEVKMTEQDYEDSKDPQLDKALEILTK